MTDRNRSLPSAKHPIEITPTGQHVSVHVNQEMIADTFNELTVREADYPEVQYIPLTDTVTELLERSETTSYCPYKGEARYYNLRTKSGELLTDIIWSYEQPFDAAGPIAGLIAFYPDRADVTVGGVTFSGPAPTCDCTLDD